MGSQNRGWFKSSFSASGGQGCVAVLFGDNGMVQVRDSKLPDGPILVFNRAEWEAFLLGAFAGEFELPL